MASSGLHGKQWEASTCFQAPNIYYNFLFSDRLHNDSLERTITCIFKHKSIICIYVSLSFSVNVIFVTNNFFLFESRFVLFTNINMINMSKSWKLQNIYKIHTFKWAVWAILLGSRVWESMSFPRKEIDLGSKEGFFTPTPLFNL